MSSQIISSFDADRLRKEVRKALSQGLCQSATFLCNFLLSASRPSASSSLAGSEQQTNLADTLLLFAESLEGLKEYNRALNYYTKALELNQRLKKKCKSDSLIKLKIADCHLCLKQDNLAAKILESIPIDSRPVRINLRLGQLLEGLNKTRGAIACYQAVIQKNPLAIEATAGLFRLGCPPQSNAHKEFPFLASYFEARTHAAKLLHSQAYKSVHDLSQKFRCNVDLLLDMAEFKLQTSNLDQVSKILESVRKTDPCVVDMMDFYGLIMRIRGRVADLNQLSQDLLSINHQRPETWVVVALYSDQLGDSDKALKYLDKAIALSSRHLCAYIVKGFIHFASHQHELAVHAYRRAFQINNKHILSFQGLVESYLAVPLFKEALLAAKEALTLMPRNPKALTLVGMVLAHSVEGREKAMKAFTKALNIDSDCLDAVIALVKLYILEKQYTKAIAFLEKYLLHHNKDFMHTKLANLYALSGDTDQALVHYHTALSLSPNYLPALHGIERMENAMKGMEDGQDDLDANLEDEDEEDEEEYE